MKNSWRAFAPLDSIAQAAGRCNRSGEFAGPGVLTVFEPDEPGTKRPCGYEAGVNALHTLLHELRTGGIDREATDLLNDPAAIRRYYEIFYGLGGKAEPGEALKSAVDDHNFPAVAAAYRLIEGQQVNVLVPYDRPAFDALIDRFESEDRGPGWTRQWLSDARPHAVGMYVHQLPKLAACGAVDPLPLGDERRDEDSSQWWRLLDDQADRYDADVGLVLPEDAGVLPM